MKLFNVVVNNHEIEKIPIPNLSLINLIILAVNLLNSKMRSSAECKELFTFSNVDCEHDFNKIRQIRLEIPFKYHFDVARVFKVLNIWWLKQHFFKSSNK